jgi:hypothetical protein
MLRLATICGGLAPNASATTRWRGTAAAITLKGLVFVRFINELLGALAALLAATAIGAVWSLAGLAGNGPAAWMAPVAALGLVAVLRFNRHAAGAARAAWSLVLLAICAAHANYLMSAGFIAGQMGLDLLDALRIIGVEMAFAVTRARLAGMDYLAYAVAALLAVALGLRQPGEGAPSAQRGRR